jgi:hypothetical protein
MATRIENTALMNATFGIDSEVAAMTNEQMENEMVYQATMSIAKNLLNQGIISEKEYGQIDTRYRKKYSISLSTLFTDIRLINRGDYGNMGH